MTALTHIDLKPPNKKLGINLPTTNGTNKKVDFRTTLLISGGQKKLWLNILELY